MTVAVQREKWSLQPAPRTRVLRLLAQRGSHPFRPMTYLMRHKPRAARGDSRHCPLMPVSRKLRSRTERSIEEEIPWRRSQNLGNLCHTSQGLRTTSRKKSAHVPTSCTRSAEGLTGTAWTTGSKRKQRFSERRSRAPNRKRFRDEKNLSVDGDQAGAHGDLGHSGRKHRGRARRRRAAPVRLGCRPDRRHPD